MSRKSPPPDRAPLPIRIFFKVGSFINPSLVVNSAVALFFRPLRFKSPERQLRFEALVDSGWFLSKSEQIRVYRKPASGPRLLFVHGWSGRSAQFAEFFEFFSALGYDCTAFDAPGHGLSEDGPVDLMRISQICRELADSEGGFDAGIGHSLGGMALHLCSSQGLQLQRLATVASPFSIARVVAEFCSRIGAGQRLEQPIMQRLKKRYSSQPELFESEPWCAHHHSTGLIVHDRDDSDVAFEDAELYLKHWQGSELLETRGLGHRKPLRDSGVMKALERHLREVVRPTFRSDRDIDL